MILLVDVKLQFRRTINSINQFKARNTFDTCHANVECFVRTKYSVTYCHLLRVQNLTLSVNFSLEYLVSIVCPFLRIINR